MSTPINVERYEAAALAARQRRYRKLVEHGWDVTTLLNTEGVVEYVSDSVTRTLGYAVEEYLGRGLAAMVHPDDLARVTDLLRTLTLAPGNTVMAEMRASHKDGRWLWMEVTATNRTDDADIAALVVNSRDVTERVQAIAARRDSEARLRLAVAATNVGLYDWDLRTNQIRYSREWKQQIGYEDDEISNDLEEWRSRVHPDDLERCLKTAFSDVSAHRLGFELEFRFRHKDGSYRWIMTQAAILRDEQGTPISVLGSHVDITERKRADEALRTSEERYRTVVEDQTELIARFTPDGALTFVNDVVCRLAGKTADEMLGGQWDRATVPEDLPLVVEQLRTMTPTNPVVVIENRLLSPSGQVHWVHFVNRGFFDRDNQLIEIQAVGRDVTERRQAETLLRESQARLSGIVDAAMDGIVTLDEQETILLFNAAAEKIFDYPAAAAIGQPVERFIPQRLRSAHHQHFQSFSQTGKTQRANSGFARISGLRANGEEFPIEASISRVEVDRRMLFTIILRDVTERVRSEEARAQLEAQLRLAQKMEALGTLAGGVAHDFNNILGAIIGNVELAAQDVGRDHPAVESLNEIRKASRRAKDLVQRILAFGRQQPQPQGVTSLRPVLEEAVRLLRASLPAGIELGTTFDADTPTVLADPTQVHQVVMNLCANAWQAMGGHTGRIDIRLDGVTLDAEGVIVDPALRPGRFAILSVTDTGSGMDPATLERIFEPFFTTKPVDQGTGLGLSVVHGIMKAHGGTITVTSQPGKGTTFSLYFPAAEAVEKSVVAPEAAVPDFSPATGNRHVLYLDDEEALVFLITRMLERLGYRVSGYTRAEEALAAVRADPGQFDLVVTDLNMPGLSGLEVARELARLRPDLPVVLASGYITEELRTAAPQAGIRHLIYKPDTVEELCAVVKRLLDEQSRGEKSRG
jgi:PAS domain S-box-containing protein